MAYIFGLFSELLTSCKTGQATCRRLRDRQLNLPPWSQATRDLSVMLHHDGQVSLAYDTYSRCRPELTTDSLTRRCKESEGRLRYRKFPNSDNLGKIVMWCSGNTEPSTSLHVAQQYEKGFPKLLSSALMELFYRLTFAVAVRQYTSTT